MDGREYVITTGQARSTPLPWSNVIANAQFGTVITESGQAYTWGENAHEYRLTPWHGDPVSDCGGEAFYLRDEESGSFWSPTPLPKCGATPYCTRHGFGYSVFEHSEEGIHSELWVYVALDASVKFAVLKVRNDSERPRQLSATAYVEWVLGDLRAKTAMHVVIDVDQASGALLARNPYNSEFAGRVAFFDTDGVDRTMSGDRTEFIGRNGSLGDPRGDGFGTAFGQGGTGARSLRRHPGSCRAGRGPGNRSRFSPRYGPQPGRSAQAGAALPRFGGGSGCVGQGAAILAADTRRGPGQDARPVA
jgi:cellobiose phosphorylase